MRASYGSSAPKGARSSRRGSSRASPPDSPSRPGSAGPSSGRRPPCAPSRPSPPSSPAARSGWRAPSSPCAAPSASRPRASFGRSEVALIEVRSAAKRYGDLAALRDVSFDIERGEWISVMGPSGSGKTTLVNLLAGLDTPTEGEVRFEGRDLARMGAADLALHRRENVGLVFQQYHLVPYLTALENVMLAQYLHSLPDEGEARRALAEVGLGERAGPLPGELRSEERAV